MIALADVIEAVTGMRPSKPGLNFKEATYHSKRVHANSLFIALPGNTKDGHTYVGDAFHRGARAAVVQQDLGNLYPVIDLRAGQLPEPLSIPKVPFCLRVENTTAALLALAVFWRKKLAIASVAIASCTDESVVRDLVSSIIGQRWPEVERFYQPEDLQTLCFDLLDFDPSVNSILVEIQPGQLESMAPILDLVQPKVGLVSIHPSYHSSELPCAADSTETSADDLVKYLPDAQQRIILNYDDPEERQVGSQPGVHPVYYGLNPLADLWADEIESDGQEGISFHVHFRFETLVLRTPLLGHNSVHLALQAAAAGLAAGLTWQEIARGLRMEGNGMHLLTVRMPNGATLIDDTYSLSAESTLAALNLISQFEGRKVAVLGEVISDGQAEANVEMVGTRAAEICQVIIVVGEKARPLIEGAKRSRTANRTLIWTAGPQEAIRQLNARIKPEDIVLFKGSHDIRMDLIVEALTGGKA